MEAEWQGGCGLDGPGRRGLNKQGELAVWRLRGHDQWINGSMDQWINGSIDQWINGSMDQWINE